MAFMQHMYPISIIINLVRLSLIIKRYNAASIDARTLKFCSTRLNSLIRTLELPDISQFSPISVIADFATLVGTYNDGFTLLIEPYDDRTPNLIDPVSFLSLLVISFRILLLLFFDKIGASILLFGRIAGIETCYY